MGLSKPGKPEPTIDEVRENRLYGIVQCPRCGKLLWKSDIQRKLVCNHFKGGIYGLANEEKSAN